MGQQKSSSMMALRDERMLASVIIAAIDTLLVLFVSFLDAFLVVFFVLSCILCCVCQRDWIEFWINFSRGPRRNSKKLL
jgi:hypothetical protein